MLNSEEIAAKPNVQETHVHNWLKGKNLGGFRPEPLADGDWRITLPANAFDPGGPVPPSKLGSYVVLSSCLLRVDCDDEETRKRTLLTRVENYLAGRSRVTAADVEARIDRVARQLRLSADMRSVREMASGTGGADSRGGSRVCWTGHWNRIRFAHWAIGGQKVAALYCP